MTKTILANETCGMIARPGDHFGREPLSLQKRPRADVGEGHAARRHVRACRRNKDSDDDALEAPGD
jgi:hypothetical protein